MDHFDEMESTKDYYGYFFDLTDAVVIVIMGSFCGLRNLKQIHQWAIDERIKTFLRKYFSITDIPCYWWFTQIINIVDSESFNRRFTEWVLSLAGENLKDKTISFDGKTVRSTGKMKNYKNPLHIVSAQIAELGITFGQKSVDGKSNEIPAVQELVETLNINGCVIVADALNCQKETARKIVEGGGDYILSVKDNQSTLKSEIEDYVQDDSLRATMDKASKTEKNRERIETRVAYATSEIDWLFRKDDFGKDDFGKDEWTKLCCIGAINTRFITEKGTTNEWHYYISSRNLTAEELLSRARAEWSVESMHWLLDVHFAKDFCRCPEQQTQENLNIIRKIVLNSIRIYKEKLNIKKPISGLLFDCLLNPHNIIKFL